MKTLAVLRQNRILQIPAALLTLGLMWLLPFLVHLIPIGGAVPVGARLLPIFYAPLLAVWFFQPGVALFASLLMPFINHALTGMPTFNVAIILSVELTVFSLTLIALKQRWPRLPVAAPLLAVLIGKLVSMLLLFIVPLVPASPWYFFSQALVNALPGLLILLALNLALTRLLPHER